MGKMKKKPNIILIMSDEHNSNILGASGNSAIKTPNLDRLAKSGVAFNNCYCNSPLCVPSRLSFTAGRYISREGVEAYNNHSTLPENATTIPKLIREAGYESYLSGKMHYIGHSMHGFRELYPFPLNGIPDADIREEWGPDAYNHPMEEYVERFNMHEAKENSGILDFDREVTRVALDFIHQRDNGPGPFFKPGNSWRTQPYFLLVGYTAPHFPCHAPQKWVSQYSDQELPPICSREEQVTDLPCQLQNIHKRQYLDKITEKQATKLKEGYYGLVSWLDNEIGHVIDAVMKSDEADNTIIIYTSDHGEMLGEHGFWWKQTFFEASAKVPLIINHPASRWGNDVQHQNVCSLLDLGKTLLELTNAEIPNYFDGNSLVPLLEGNEHCWPNIAISEHYANLIDTGMAMIRKDNYKLNTYGDGQMELYDLEEDPGELCNLADKPEFKSIIRKLHIHLESTLHGSVSHISEKVQNYHKNN
jgi:choline-sulfatase